MIGSSKIENELSRWAEKATDPEGNLSEFALFLVNQQDAATGANHKSFHYEFNPPMDVLERQFCTMAKEFGFSSATEFALAVEGMTQEQRRNCLDSFYKIRAEKLRNAEGIKPEDDTKAEVDDTESVKTETDVDDQSDVGSHLEAKTNIKKEDPPAQITRTVIANIKQEPDNSDVKAAVPIALSQDKPKLDRRSVSIWLSDDEETDEL